MAIEKPREIALSLLFKATSSEELLDRLVHRTLGESGMSPRDRGLVQELVFGVTRWRRLLDALIDDLATEMPRLDVGTGTSLTIVPQRQQFANLIA